RAAAGRLGYATRGGCERETPGKRAQSAQHLLLTRAQQAVAPVESRLQSAMTRIGSRCEPEETEAIIQMREQRRQPESRDARRGELERKRDAIEAPHDLGDEGRVGRGECEAPVGRD